MEPGMSRRCFDCVAAALGLAVLSPLFLVIALSIRLDDGGPVLFTQQRLGRFRRPFRIYKFRTMRDGVVTRVGAGLRATGLDELPQLVNLLRGDMSLIGPRPLTSADVERLGWNDGAYDARWRLRPGIGGLAQLYAGRGARVSWFLDRRYVRERSLQMDFAILFATAAVSLAGKRRVRTLLRPRGASSARRSVRSRALGRLRRARSLAVSAIGSSCTRLTDELQSESRVSRWLGASSSRM
jgi:lipopolysaccharide/colanic/teichoic acid biosynthesis glycosyltransferase